MGFSLNTLLSILGGVLPALFWLWFWLHEDKKHPEPKKRIFLSFIFGMIAVAIVLPIEKLLFKFSSSEVNTTTLFLWAAVEELIKFGAAYFVVLRSREVDEPVDFLIYMLSTALGFSAFENTLFLLNGFDSSLLGDTLIRGNMRFIGATLLHTLTSATIGAFMALSFYKNKEVKRLALVAGLSLAIALHTLFNFFIMNVGQRVFFVFGAVWLSIMALIFMFEKIKSIKPDNKSIPI